MEPLYLFFHIPETGGQTLRDHLLSELVNGHDYLHLGRLGPTDPCPRTMDDVMAMSDEQRRRVRVISGHDVSRDLSRVFARRPIREVTFLREPAQRIISHYNFAMTMRYRLGRPVQAFKFVE